MNNLNEKIKEIKLLIANYNQKIKALEKQENKLQIENSKLNSKLLNLDVIMSRAEKRNYKNTNVYKKHKFMEILFKLFALLANVSVAAMVISCGGIINILSSSAPIFNVTLETMKIILCASAISLLVSYVFAKKIAQMSNEFSELAYHNYLVFEDHICDLDRCKKEYRKCEKEIKNISTEINNCELQIQSLISKNHNLELLINGIVNYKTSLDEQINQVYIDNLPKELNDKIENILLKNNGLKTINEMNKNGDNLDKFNDISQNNQELEKHSFAKVKK